MRDYSGERGPVPTEFRAHDWRVCRVLRELADDYRVRRESIARLAERVRGWRG